MEIGQLQAFECAAREGSFTQAADVLGLTQPSVSARILALEDELGCALFERGGRRLRLTLAGELFLSYVERTLATLSDGVEALQRYHKGEIGRLRICSLAYPVSTLLVDPLTRFRTHYPSVDVVILERVAQEVIELVTHETSLLGLLGTRRWQTGLRVHARFLSKIHFVAAPDHPLAQQAGPLKLADLYDHTVYRVTLDATPTRFVEDVVEYARPGSGGAALHVPAIMVIPMLIDGQGIAFLPEFVVQRHIDRGRLVYLDVQDAPQFDNELRLISAQGRELDPPTRAFIEVMRLHWKSLVVD